MVLIFEISLITYYHFGSSRAHTSAFPYLIQCLGSQRHQQQSVIKWPLPLFHKNKRKLLKSRWGLERVKGTEPAVLILAFLPKSSYLSGFPFPREYNKNTYHSNLLFRSDFLWLKIDKIIPFRHTILGMLGENTQKRLKKNHRNVYKWTE